MAKMNPVVEYLGQKGLHYCLEWTILSGDRTYKRCYRTLSGVLVHGEILISVGRETWIRNIKTGKIIWKNGDFLLPNA